MCTLGNLFVRNLCPLKFPGCFKITWFAKGLEKYGITIRKTHKQAPLFVFLVNYLYL